jgi:hypothetical protein
MVCCNISEEDDFIVDSGQFRPDCLDPDYSNSTGTNIKDELEFILKVFLFFLKIKKNFLESIMSYY